MHFYIRVLVILPLSFSLSLPLPVSVRLSLHPLQSARGGVSPRAKHMLLSIALIQMQRGGIIARVAVASQRLCPSLAPVSQAHAISINSLPLSLSVSNSDLLSNQALTLHKHIATSLPPQHSTHRPLPPCCCCCQVIIFGAPSSLILTAHHVGSRSWQNGCVSNDDCKWLFGDFWQRTGLFPAFQTPQTPSNIPWNKFGHLKQKLRIICLYVGVILK